MKYNLVHNLLSVDTSENYIPYFHYSPALDNLIEGNTKIVLGYYVKDKLKRPDFLKQKFDFCWASHDSKIVYYEHPLIFGKKAQVLLDMSGKVYKLFANRIYNKFVKFKFDNVWSPGQHFSNLLTIKLLQDNILTLHCSSFSDIKTKKGFLVFGPSNTGKSLTVFNAIKQGYQYHSEDLTIMEGKTIHSLPMISANSDKLPNKDLKLKMHIFIERSPIINLLIPRFHTTKTFRKFAEGINLNAVSQLDKIFILERGKRNLSKISNDEAFRRTLILNRIELAYYKDHLFRTYSYFNKDLDIERLYENETKLISKIINESDCYLVSSNSPADYFNLISKKL